MRFRRRAVIVLMGVLVPLGMPAVVVAQAGAAASADRPYEGTAVSAVRFEGLERVNEQFVRNQITIAVGRPLDWDTVRSDLGKLERLGEFRELRAELEPTADGQAVAVVFVVVEAPIVTDIVVAGNRQITDDQIAEVVRENVALVANVPIDDFRIRSAQRAIEDLYRGAGYLQASVTINEEELERTGTIIFQVREGERVRLTSIRFEGNESFSNKKLQSQINLRVAGIFRKGVIDDEILRRDVAAVRRFYLNEGYLDARVSRVLQPSPDGKEMIITFVIEEGPIFTLREMLVFRRGAPVEAEDAGLKVMHPDQVRGLALLKPGAIAKGQGVRDTERIVESAYRQMGYTDASVNIEVLRIPDSTQVDMIMSIRESDASLETGSDRFRAGIVTVRGNELTQRDVILRQLGIEPDDWLDSSDIEETERQLRNRGLFAPAGTRITIQDEDARRPGYRDVLVEVQETNTGTLSFGASVNSDAGLIGNISLRQNNFDIYDTPDSFGEFFRGRAFRGAGQTFNLLIAPGTELSTYSISLTEPALFETSWSAGGELFFRQRDFEDFFEERLGGRARFGRSFGTRWRGSILFAAQSIEIDEDSADPLQDIADVEGTNVLTELGFELARTTVDDFFRPARGTRSEFRVTQGGGLGGDFTYTRLEAEHTVFIPIIEDELGRTTTLRLNSRVGYVPNDDELPIFERFYLGGRSLRGFEFRGIGPVGDRVSGAPTEDQVGGSFLFFAGAQFQRPIASDILDWVVFVDAGTIDNDVSLEDLRVGVGTGIRLYLPQFGRAPLAFDFGIPILEEDTDETQVFTFSIEFPF